MSKKENRTKVKGEEMADTPDVAAYERFVCTWHFFLKRDGELLASGSEGGAKADEPVSAAVIFPDP